MHSDEISIFPILQRFRRSENVSYVIKDKSGFVRLQLQNIIIFFLSLKTAFCVKRKT